MVNFPSPAVKAENATGEHRQQQHSPDESLKRRRRMSILLVMSRARVYINTTQRLKKGTRNSTI
eukprot:scaffold95398_cov85-Attheya_sp.AAC.3